MIDWVGSNAYKVIVRRTRELKFADVIQCFSLLALASFSTDRRHGLAYAME
jgi:hypothetical protein